MSITEKAASRPSSGFSASAFSYLANIDNSNYKGACDFSKGSQCDSNTAHPEWVDAIKLQALKTCASAFASLPAIAWTRLCPAGALAIGA